MTFSVSQKRIYVIFGIFAVVLILIVTKLFLLQIVEADANRKAAVETRTISYNVAPKRGTIYDRNGNILAYSKEARTVYANPSEVENATETAGILASHLGGTASDYIDLINDPSKKFSYIKRRIELDVSDALKAEELKGIYFQEDQKREYPYGETAGQIIGAVNFDGDGLCGIELYYDDVLRGSTGKTVRQQGMYGMPIPGGVLQETSVIDGQDIMLTIDVELQQKVEATLKD